MSDPYDTLRRTALGPLVERHGEVTLAPADDLFEPLAAAVVDQSVSVAAARTVRERLFDAVEMTPEGVLAADTETLRETGLSERKVEYLRNAAEWFRAESVTHERFTGMDDEAVVADLTSIRGVGAWTARRVLIFGLAREDVFLLGDLAVRRAMESLYDADLARGEMRDRSEAWRPYRSYATLYLWEEYLA